MGTTIGRPGEPSPTGGEVRLGKYVLDAPLGVGGMAEVFKGRTVGAEGFQRPVAIKRVLPDASRNPAFSEMFVAEAMLSSRMQHANVVSVLDFNRDDEGRLYLVMELVEGRDLDAIIESGRLPYGIVIHTISEVLRGLGYAHDLPAGADGVRGLVHRDVSPHNVLCSWSGAVKVSDFGIAKARAATAASASVVIKGKPAYMSPEQINGAPLDGRSDLFAVGIMLWQMLTGQYLFAAGTTTETLARVLFGNVAPPSSIVPDVPPDLEAVTMRLLAREPAQRYATAEDAVEDLLRCQHAPRNGRRELEELLIARFPEKAPMRTGQRSRSVQAPTAPSAIAQGTPGGAGAPPVWSGGTGSVVPGSAATVPGRVDPAVAPPPAPMPGSVAMPGPVAAAPARRGALLAGAAIAVVGIVVVVIVLAAGGGGAGQPGLVPAVAADGGPPGNLAATDAGVVEAAAIDADQADTAAIDAGVSDASATDAAGAITPADAAPPPIDARRRSTRDGGAGAGSSTIHDVTPRGP